MSFDAVAQNLVFGILVGSLYGLGAIGLSLVFGVLRVLNVAHGELLMLGGYGSFWLFTLYGVDPFVSLLIIGPLLFALGLLLHLGIFSHVARFDEDTKIKNSLLIGFGLSLVIQTLAVRLWTADDRGIATAYSGATVHLGGVAFPLVRVGSVFLALAITLLVYLFLNRTYLGKSIRATAEDWEAASLVGINIRRTYLVCFALGTALAGLAGTLVTIGYSVNPGIGLEWTLKALVVVVLAGLGSIVGTFLGGIVLGLAEAGSVYAVGGSYREVVGLVLFLAVLILRPQGLFGRKQ